MAQFLSYSCLLPPTVFIVLCLLASLAALSGSRVWRYISVAGSICLYLFATPAVALLLLERLEPVPSNVIDSPHAQAIVILGADIHSGNGADVPYSVGPMTLERLAFGAQIYRRLRLPVLVSGGPIDDRPISLAGLMQQELEQDFSVPVTFIENKSKNTFENALYATPILKSNGISNIIVVTQDRDLRRALWSFSELGIHASSFGRHNFFPRISIIDFLPSTKSLLECTYELHEILGLIYYKMVH